MYVCMYVCAREGVASVKRSMCVSAGEHVSSVAGSMCVCARKDVSSIAYNMCVSALESYWPHTPQPPPPHTPLPNHQRCISYCSFLPARHLLPRAPLGMFVGFEQPPYGP